MHQSWEESKQEAKNLNEQIVLKDQYAGKLKHLLEKGLSWRDSRKIISCHHVHTISQSPFSFDWSNIFLQG